MSCIEKLDRYIIPSDMVVSLSKVYSYIGKNEYFKRDLNNDLSKIVEDTIERDSYFLSVLTNLNLSDNRMRLIISKSSSPRTNEESILANIKILLDRLQLFASDVKIDSDGILTLMNEIYSSKHVSYINDESRSLINTWCNKVSFHKEEEDYENLYLDIHYLVDLYNLKPLNDHNDMLILIMLYIMLLRCNCECFKYISLYELIYSSYTDFLNKLSDTSFGWSDGHSQTKEVITYILDIIKEGYVKCQKIIRSYSDEMNSNKADSIENTIYNLPRTFSKEDIRVYHPFTSESTINRVLTKLRTENQIKPTGNGRSAKWIKTGMM